MVVMVGVLMVMVVVVVVVGVGKVGSEEMYVHNSTMLYIFQSKILYTTKLHNTFHSSFQQTFIKNISITAHFNMEGKCNSFQKFTENVNNLQLQVQFKIVSCGGETL